MKNGAAGLLVFAPGGTVAFAAGQLVAAWATGAMQLVASSAPTITLQVFFIFSSLIFSCLQATLFIVTRRTRAHDDTLPSRRIDCTDCRVFQSEGIGLSVWKPDRRCAVSAARMMVLLARRTIRLALP